MNLGFGKASASLDKVVGVLVSLDTKWWWANFIGVTMPFNCLVCMCASHTRDLSSDRHARSN